MPMVSLSFFIIYSSQCIVMMHTLSLLFVIREHLSDIYIISVVRRSGPYVGLVFTLSMLFVIVTRVLV